MMDFHQRLRQFRSSANITQSRLAELRGLSRRDHTRREAGDATPLFGTVVKIADILNITFDELACRTDATSGETRDMDK